MFVNGKNKLISCLECGAKPWWLSNIYDFFLSIVFLLQDNPNGGEDECPGFKIAYRIKDETIVIFLVRRSAYKLHRHYHYLGSFFFLLRCLCASQKLSLISQPSSATIRNLYYCQVLLREKWTGFVRRQSGFLLGRPPGY